MTRQQKGRQWCNGRSRRVGLTRKGSLCIPRNVFSPLSVSLSHLLSLSLQNPCELLVKNDDLRWHHGWETPTTIISSSECSNGILFLSQVSGLLPTVSSSVVRKWHYTLSVQTLKWFATSKRQRNKVAFKSHYVTCWAKKNMILICFE